MKLSIIITNYRTPDKLKQCLQSIFEYKLDRIFNFWEVIVSDSGTIENEQKQITDLFPEIKFLPHQKNIGYARAVNRALKITQGDYLLIINSDIIIPPDSHFEEMVNFLSQNQQTVGLIGPRLTNIDGSHQYSAFRFYNPLTILARRTIFGKTKIGQKIKNKFVIKKEINNSIKTEKPLGVDWLMGSALLTTKTTAEKIGLFDERFFMYFEDVDWCRRFKKCGYKVIYFPKCRMIHYHLQSSQQIGGIIDFFISRYTRTHILSWLKYCWKWKSFF